MENMVIDETGNLISTEFVFNLEKHSEGRTFLRFSSACRLSLESMAESLLVYRRRISSFFLLCKNPNDFIY